MGAADVQRIGVDALMRIAIEHDLVRANRGAPRSFRERR